MHVCVCACLCTVYTQKGTIDYHFKVGQHPLEYTFPTLSGRNMHNDIVVNIPTEASPAAEQFTGNIWPCLCIASYLGWVLNDCFLSILANSVNHFIWCSEAGPNKSYMLKYISFKIWTAPKRKKGSNWINCQFDVTIPMGSMSDWLLEHE